MAKIGIPINPGCKRFKKKKDLEKFISFSEKNDILYEFVDFSDNPSMETYLTPLDNLFNRGMEILLGASGDGGHSLIDSALFYMGMQQTVQGNLRMGTANLRAESSLFPHRTFSLRLFADSTMLHLLKLIHSTYSEKDISEVKILPRSLLHLKSSSLSQHGFAYSSGLVQNFFDYYTAGSSNQMEALRIISRGFLSSLFPSLESSKEFMHNITKPSLAKVYLDNVLLYNQSHSGIFITSQDIKVDFGPFLELAPTQCLDVNDSGKIRYLGTESSTLIDYLRQVPLAFHLRSNPVKNLDLEDLHCGDYSTVRIIPDGLHRYIFDGNLHETKDPFTIKLTEKIPYLSLP